MKPNIILILKENYLELILNKYNMSYNVIKQTINEKICHDVDSLPIIICDELKNLLYLKDHYFSEKIIFLGKKDEHKYSLTYPLKFTELLSLVENAIHRKIRILFDKVIFSAEQQSLSDRNFHVKLNHLESLLCCLLIESLKEDLTKEFISNHLWYKQSLLQKYKNFDNLIYKFRKKIEPFSLNLAIKENNYYIQKIN